MRLWRPSAERLLDVVFFAGLLAYAYFGIDPRLIYHWQAPLFEPSAGFLKEHLTYPGGIADYLQAFLSQAYRWQLWGALILTAQVAAVSVLSGGLFPTLRLLPAIPLLYQLNLYSDRTPLAPMLIIGLAGALLCSRRAALWPFFLLLLPVYWLGGRAVVIFALAAAGRMAASRRYAHAGFCLLAAAAVPLGIERLRVLRPSAAPTLTVALIALCALYASGPFLPVANLSRRWRTLLATALTLGALAGMAAFSYRTNARDRRLAVLDYRTASEDWEGVIAASSALKSADFNSLTRYEVNLALHETNRLGEDMFRYPQADSALPRLRMEVFLPYMVRVTDMFLRLGRINDAEHYGSEALVLSPSDARVRDLLAKVNLVKGRTGAAAKLVATASMDSGALELYRRRMLRSDDVIPVWQNPEKPDADVNRLLLDQLEQDPSNRMAFEFLMANYLLSRDLPAARALIPRIRQMTGPAYEGPNGARRTPRHYQEALAMYADGSGQPVNVDGVSVGQETLSRMAVFKRLMSQSPGRDAAMQASWDRFRDSYFFYFVFGPGDYR